MDIHEFVYLATVFLGVAFLTTALSSRLGLGTILGFILAGIVIGPSVLDISGEGSALREFTELGVVLLLFQIGLEMNPRRLWELKGMVFGLGAAQVVGIGVVLAAILQLVGSSWQSALILGFGLALSSTAFVLPILGERGQLQTRHGQVTLSVLLFQDLAIIPLLAMVSFLAAGSTAETFGLRGIGLGLGGLTMVAVIGKFVFPRLADLLLRRNNRKAFAGLVLFAVVGSAYLMDLAGLSMALGTFTLGVLLSGTKYNHQIEAIVDPYKSFLLDLFFISIGMSISLHLLVSEPLRFVGVALLIITVKVLILFLLALAFRVGRATAARVAVLLGQSGEFGFVLFGAAFSSGLILEPGFNKAILVISLTLLTTPFLARLSERAGRWCAGRGPGGHRVPDPLPVNQQRQHVILAGYGRVGATIDRMLTEAGIPSIAFDLNPDRVHEVRQRGGNLYYGDLSEEKILANAGIAEASALVITVRDPAATRRILRTAQESQADLPIFVRTRFLSEADEMMEAGATEVLPDTLESSLRLGERILESAGVDPGESRLISRHLRENGYRALRQNHEDPDNP